MMSDVLALFKKDAQRFLPKQGAFLRLDRGEALFVCDAPRRGIFLCAGWEEEFEIAERNGLLFLTPRLTFVPLRLRQTYLRMLKAMPAARERLIRQTLAECLRLKNGEEIAFMDQLYKEEIP